MICHMKHVFVWIFLIPQPTGNVLYVGVYSSVYFLLSFQNSIDSSYNVLFKLTAAD